MLLQGFRLDPVLSILGSQLLRSSRQGLEEGGNLPQSRDDRIVSLMAPRHNQPRLTSVMSSAGNPVQQKRSAGDRLAVAIGVRQSHEKAPPPIGVLGRPGHVVAALQVPYGEVAPDPLVLKLVQAILRVRPVPVKLGDRADLEVQRRRKNHKLRTPVEDRARFGYAPKFDGLSDFSGRMEVHERLASPCTNLSEHLASQS